MAYSLPELVFVGAAQNLVLETSSLELKVAQINCYGPNDQDLEPGTYTFESSW